MKVCVLWISSYIGEQFEVVGVFESEELAIRFAEKEVLKHNEDCFEYKTKEFDIIT